MAMINGDVSELLAYEDEGSSDEKDDAKESKKKK